VQGDAMTSIIKVTLPYQRDWAIYQGSFWSRWFIYKDSNGNPVDLTGWIAKMDIRLKKGGDLVVSLAIGSGITNGGANGTITFSLTIAQTILLKGSMVYDLFLTNAGATIAVPILTGNLNITQRVSQ
jgi:hypothetical protein